MRLSQVLIYWAIISFILMMTLLAMCAATGCAVGVHPTPVNGGLDMNLWLRTNSHSVPPDQLPLAQKGVAGTPANQRSP